MGALGEALASGRVQVKTADDRKRLQESIHGVEKKPLPHMLAMTNMMLHGIDVPSQIERKNTLGVGWNEWRVHDKVDCIITNPPPVYCMAIYGAVMLALPVITRQYLTRPAILVTEKLIWLIALCSAASRKIFIIVTSNTTRWMMLTAIVKIFIICTMY